MSEPARERPVPATSTSRRRTAVGIAVVALGLAAAVFLLRPVADQPDRPPARSVSETLRDHDAGQAENDRMDAERNKPATPAEFRDRVQASRTLSSEQKQALLVSEAARSQIVERSDADHKAFLEEQEKEHRLAMARVQAKKDAQEKEKEKQKLVFSAEAAPGPFLPCQPVPVRLRLTNRGDSDVRLYCSLDPRSGDLRAEASPAGSDNFRPLFLGARIEKALITESGAATLAPGGTLTWQADLSPFLGYDPVKNSAAAVSQTLRLTLNAGAPHGVLTADDLAVTIVAPTGDEQAILVRMLKENLLSYLGTESPRTCPQRGTGDVASSLTALRSLIDAYPEASYTKDLRAGFVTILSSNWVALLKVQSKESLVAHANAVSDEYWRRDLPSGWAHAETLLPLAKLGNWSGNPAREKDAYSRFITLCPEDPRAAAARQTLQRR